MLFLSQSIKKRTICPVHALFGRAQGRFAWLLCNGMSGPTRKPIRLRPTTFSGLCTVATGRLNETIGGGEWRVFMKKAVACMLCLVMMMAFVSCGGGNDTSSVDPGSSTESEVPKVGQVTVGNNMSIKRDAVGNAMLMVTYNFTNDTDSPLSFGAAVKETVTQAGEDLERFDSLNESAGLMTAANSSDVIDPRQALVDSGSSIAIRAYYKLIDTAASVLVKCTTPDGQTVLCEQSASFSTGTAASNAE